MKEWFDRFVQGSWVYAALAALVFVAALPGLASMPVMDRDEGRFAQASSQMMESGDYVVIRYHDGLRNKKPVGIHWMQSATVSLTSGPAARDIGAYRLPSLLGAVMAALATFWAGTALFSRRAAFVGAALLGMSLLLTTEAHIAKTDAMQCGFLALGMAALAHMRQNALLGSTKSGKRLSVVFWVCLGVGILLKGVIAPMVCALTLVALFAWERRVGWAKPLLYWMGPALCFVMTVPWFIAVQIATGGEFLWEAAAVDLGQKIVSAAEGHEGPPGLHIAALPLLFWPGTLLLVPAFWYGWVSLWRRSPMLTPPRTGPKTAGRARDAMTAASLETEGASWRFLACWLIPAWLVFEIAPTKLVHYTLPMYPAIALLCGAAFDRWFNVGTWGFGRWFSLALFLFATALLAVAASPPALEAIRLDAAKDFGEAMTDRVRWLWREEWNATGVGWWPTILILLAAAGVTYAFARKQPLLILVGLVLCSLVGGISYRAAILPNQTWILSTEAALSALREVCALPEDTAQWRKSGCAEQTINGQPVRPPKIVRSIAFAEPSLVFELGGKIALPGDKESTAAIPAVADDNRPAWLINAGEEDGRKALDKLVEAAAAADRCVRFSRRFAWNYSNGDPSILVAAVVEPAGCPSNAQAPELRSTQEEEEEETELEN